ncbi:MAG TPA: hypothetical protein VIU35_07585 [Chitinophagaceae bacterium]
MRKTFLLPSMLWAAMFLFFSCQKEKKSINQNSSELQSKINLWLEEQNITSNITKKNNIQSLKINLEFSKVRFEKLGQNEQFLVVPISEEYKKTGKFEKSSIINLLLVIDELGNIKRGNISEFIPESSSRMDKLPSNTFFNLYNNCDLECDGTFRFLSVTGKWLHQFGVTNGKVSSKGIVKGKIDAPNTASISRINSCIVYWWVTEYYNFYGEIIRVTEQYIGMVCTNEDCADPNNAMLCPDGTGDSGGGTGGEPESCCIVDPNVQFTSQLINIQDDICGLEGSNPVTGNPTKPCTHRWTFHRWHALWFTWTFTSIANADLEKEAGTWKFKTATFQGVARDGQLPYCISSVCIVNSAVTSIRADKLKAKLILDYTIENKVVCYSWWSPNNSYNTLTNEWSPPQ